MVKLSPLVQSDYPAIMFWNKLDWKKTENSWKDSSDLEAKIGECGGTRCSKGENVMMRYIENEDGSPVEGALATSIREFARSIWRGFYSQSIASVKWGDAPLEVRDRYCHEMESAFMVLRYCDNHWKAHMVATSIYSQWYHRFHNKNLKKHQGIKEEPALQDEPARKKNKTDISSNLGRMDDSQPPHSEGQSNSVITHKPTPVTITLNDPLYL